MQGCDQMYMAVSIDKKITCKSMRCDKQKNLGLRCPDGIVGSLDARKAIEKLTPYIPRYLADEDSNGAAT